MSRQKKDRRQFIRNTFKCIADGDMCGLCTVFRGKDPEVAYSDYIKGKCDYLDCNADLTDENGEQKPEYAIDGVHMYANGYLKVFDSLVQYLR